MVYKGLRHLGVALALLTILSCSPFYGKELNFSDENRNGKYDTVSYTVYSEAGAGTEKIEKLLSDITGEPEMTKEEIEYHSKFRRASKLVFERL